MISPDESSPPRDPQNHGPRNAPSLEPLTQGRMLQWAPLPPDAAVQAIAFVTERTAGIQVLLEFPAAMHRRAVLVPYDSPHDLLVLTLATRTGETTHDLSAESIEQIRNWVDAASSVNDPIPVQTLLMTLQGAQIFWHAGRLAILAPEDRLPSVCKALVEIAFYEAETREIERLLGENWPQLERDTPLAFEFAERSIPERQKLRQRFQQTLLLRMRLARIAPFVHGPHLHPPTLASQAAERFRERTQLAHRHEFLDEQIEVFEHVYEMCGEKANDYMLTRTGNILECVIILLLLAQILMSAFDLMPATPPDVNVPNSGTPTLPAASE